MSIESLLFEKFKIDLAIRNIVIFKRNYLWRGFEYLFALICV